ncbi:carbohydrate porin [Methylobacterium sp. E-045]|uniref:carbohydrate porin n=1 Tax=Methylobacterium sp. E-045 TaxID=2836575 RepID=UPI001FBACD7C|nr:carbohydrate porin [Methylobacterium sp. E-045]MCJ2128265.1 carbohydrate porin [Methylobacterium sp. E-045]
MQTVGRASRIQARADGTLASRLAVRCSVFAVASAALTFATNPARAQASDIKSAFAPAVAAAQAAKTASGTGADDETAKFKYFDSLGEKGWIVPRPSTAESVIADTGGVRSALAEYGIGFLGLGSYSFFVDTLQQSGGRQVYNGQQPTFGSSTTFAASLNLDLYGVPNAQITAAGTRLTTTWRPFGPPAFSLQRLNYYQSFFNGKLELKVGYTTNNYEFFGTSVGGNIISGTLGPNANILYQAGMARTPLTAPAINVRWNGPDNIYVKSGVQRSISPDGSEAEHDANPSGFRFRTPKASALFINEVGYKRLASGDELSLWVRGGFLYNDSPYTIFGTTRTSSNAAFALLADTQLLKTDPVYPERGIYGGVSFLKGDPNVDGTDQYYEGRLYGVGVIPQRPKDFISLVYTHNKFSDRVFAITQARGFPAVDRINNLTVSYSIHLARGVFLNNGLTYGDHAATSPITRPVLVFASALAVVF